MALSFFSVFFFFTLSTICCYVSHGQGDQTHTIHLQSLLPSSLCNSSQGTNKVGVLKVVHKHGPCSQLVHEQKGTSQADLLRMDQSRVKLIHARLSKKAADLKGKDSINLPAKSGRTIGSGNYIVTVGLGTPKRDLSLAFDTGSDLTWTQCQPCDGSCYQQEEPIFDPSQSNSYSNVSCAASLCSDLASTTGQAPSCYGGSACIYRIRYGDQSITEGFFGKETLSLTSTDVFNGFFFGCGQNNQGLFRGAAGLLGLGRDKLSVVQQTAAKYGRFFSYCLPSTVSGTGHLTFGRAAGGVSNSAKFTPLSATTSDFYGLDFTGISVGGKPLSISPSVFATSGAIIDSGTVITRLPPAAYSALRAAFREMMSKYPMAKAFSILDTCYDLSSYQAETVEVPKIAFSFSGGVTVEIDGSGILLMVSATQACLGFAGNSDPRDVAIYGNTQQLKLEVVYDVAGGRVGFAPGGCA